MCLFTIPASALAAGGSPATDLRFGVMTHFAHGWDPELVAAVARSGVATVRDEIYWRDVEPQRGVFVFPERYDRTMSTLAQHQIEPLVVLSFENEAYDGGNTPYSDEAIQGFARYGTELLRRYGGQVRAVEVWNEYNGEFVRGVPEGERVGTYLRMLRAVYQQVKRDRPDVLVVGGATAGVPLPYWEKLLAGGALEFMDVLSVHPYRYEEEPEGIEGDIADLQALVTRYSQEKPKPIWVTEIGWNTHASRSGALRLDDLKQAQFLVRTYALLLSAGVERVYWYLFRDYNDALMGLVRSDPLATPKPAFAAMATMTHQLRGAEFEARDQTPADVYSMCFRRASGERVRVMWSLRPRALAVSGATSVTDMLGRSLGSSGALQLDVSPIFVAGDLRQLPVANEVPVADSRRGFVGEQGRNGWSFGYSRAPGDFTPLRTYKADEWHNVWLDDPPFLTVSAKEQHPSVHEGVPVGAVRRWQSDREGKVRVVAMFNAGQPGGDGVGVGIAIDGQGRVHQLLGVGEGTPASQKFEFIEAVHPGTTIDFVVDPGPGANIDHDGTAVAVKIFLINE